MKNIFCTKLPLKVYSNLNYKNRGKETGRFTAIQIHKAHTNTDWLECPDHFPPVLTNPGCKGVSKRWEIVMSVMHDTTAGHDTRLLSLFIHEV